ncbi:ectoine hydroxylase-related dioxygenase (phytanoyl-CoA dioxygenase family) [Thermocatellispora tengchongensis]|uniref:Ectoine hydroxylase-related dioxygenase (Phytanoyl-CoA dioxygenase family) n=1 Tax=Thermocatellispora tengchongensis TaxID=1073253 RepID=A0A840P0C3_9ACTN|nr:phytanoyl-CoA dioxygenase family protein [Thermocatellispora tengchongensis]MBB5132832.1 ectoine hydroxylase-related dioxygenase (phytanoyl-CoA dioxygenase family) [Thermocatellispora tengchongensis]
MADEIPVRDVTADEAAFFAEHGWVRLPGLVGPDAVARLRERAEVYLRRRERERTTLVDRAFGQSRDIAESDELFRALTFAPAMGRAATRLLRGVRGVRVQVTNLLIKEPGGGHGATEFHQDFPWMPMDRSAMLTFWLALVDVPADMGSLRFYDGSHRYGILGRSFTREGDDQLSQHPWLKELELSPSLDLAAGDATVHHSLTVHGAPANRRGTPRLSFTVTYFDADALYTGTPYAQTDGLGLTVNRPFEHPRFPPVPA